jgi:uncharacterized phage-associated protein
MKRFLTICRIRLWVLTYAVAEIYDKIKRKSYGTRMSVNVPVIIEAVGYLLSKIGKADKIHLVKLMYLADKYHAMSYGRTITDDVYYAFQNGPAGSDTENVLDYDRYVLGEYLDKAKACFKKDVGHSYSPGKDCRPPFKMLSESDIEALNFVLKKFGAKDKWDVVEYTHCLNEWLPFKSSLETKKIKRGRIKAEDILLPSKDNLFLVPREHLVCSREIITGSLE